MSRFDPQPIRATEMRSCEPGMTLNDSVYDRLLRERIIFLGQPVDDTIANQICAQLLLLAAEDPARDIALYINSPGGSVTAGMAIFDTMTVRRLRRLDLRDGPGRLDGAVPALGRHAAASATPCRTRGS